MLTISAIKADVGGVGGHTRPSARMMEVARESLQEAAAKGLIIDFDTTYTGDDICLLMVHREGDNSPDIHGLAWNTFLAATGVAQEQALYGAGQDLLVDAPSGNVRGAGPGVAELTFDETAPERPVEPFLVFTADKCGPGAFNFPLMSIFTNPMFCAGLMLPKMKVGFRFTVIDMDNAESDRVITLDTPERLIDLAVLLRDEFRFGIDAIHSRSYPDQRVVSVSAHRLHTIAGTYTGKDDPVALVRTQGIFPAPEEAVSPYVVAHFVAGDARGSHTMPLMPVAINTEVSGPYCLPLVACMAYSLTKEGKLSEGVDMFGNVAWDATRLKAQRKGEEMRQQGFFGAAMLPIAELEYGAIRDVLAGLEEEFELREERTLA
jgi:fructose 1,6-bisphosphate aldolase/phosphatase